MSDENKIIELDKHRPHYSGLAKCSSCGHSWAAVAQTTNGLECPECGNLAGEYIDVRELKEHIKKLEKIAGLLSLIRKPVLHLMCPELLVALEELENER